MSPAARLLAATLAGTAAAYLLLHDPLQPAGLRVSPIFWYLAMVFDPIGNLLLGAIAVAAFALGRRPGGQAWSRAMASLGARPWAVAGVAFPLLCLGSRFAYHAHPLSMDEYAALFQAEIFAAGRLAGQFPPALLDALVPRGFQNIFVTVSPATGAVAGTYWPGWSLLLAPFAAAGVPWAANPALTALSLPVLHRLAVAVTGSREAGGWAMFFALASPAFVVNGFSYYAMPAHLLLGALYALLLLQPTPARAALAGLVGALALNLHNPVPHLLLALPFLAWLLLSRRLAALAVLLAVYLVAGATAGFAWKLYLGGFAAAIPSAPAAGAGGLAGTGLLAMLSDHASILRFPDATTWTHRVLGLSKAWTWAAAGVLVLAGWGYWRLRLDLRAQLLAAALAFTFLGYFLVPFDQGHGWGYRYLHGAWFVLPVLAAAAVVTVGDPALRGMAGWAALLSLVLATALRTTQVESFVERHLTQVPPYTQAVPEGQREVLFVQPRQGFYAIDLIQNDPFLRHPRIVLAMETPQRAADLMATHFPGFARAAAGPWGELWRGPR